MLLMVLLFSFKLGVCGVSIQVNRAVTLVYVTIQCCKIVSAWNYNNNNWNVVLSSILIDSIIMFMFIR